VKPRPYTAFIAHSIAVFDALHERGWPRLASLRPPRGRFALEAFPHAAWRRLGLTPQPAKAKCTPRELASAARRLCAQQGIRLARPPSHDELQALAAGIAGLALLDGDASAHELLGVPPRLVDGHWREGFILAPRETDGRRRRSLAAPREAGGGPLRVTRLRDAPADQRRCPAALGRAQR
jgi:hypothetical protein